MSSTVELFTQAVNHHRYGNLQEAEKMYRMVVQQDPKHADAWHYIGFISLQGGRIPEAVEQITRAIQLDPSKSMYYGNLALAHRMAGNRDAANASLVQARQLGLNEPKGYNSLGIKFMGEGIPAAAAHCFELAIEIANDYPDGFYNLGIALNALGHTDPAILAYQRALSIKPDFVECYNNLGDILARNNRMDEAITYLEQALRLRPTHAKAHFNLGRAYHRKNDIEKAEACYRDVLKIDPDHAKTHEQLGNILESRGEIAKATEHFKEASQIKPEASESHINAGIGLMEQKSFETALARFSEALQRHPNHAMAHYYVGLCNQRIGRLEDAIKSYKEAVRLQPTLANGYFQLGDALAAYGDCNESAIACETAARIDSHHSRAIARLGDCIERQGRHERAIQCFDRALELDAQNLGYKLRKALVLPVVLESEQQAREFRQRIDEQLNELFHDTYTTADPYRDLLHRSFFSAYHAEDEKPLQEKLAKFQEKFAPTIKYKAPHCERALMEPLEGRKIRVGFVSKYFRNHTIAKLTTGIIEKLDRNIFEVTVFTFPHTPDDWTKRIEAAADNINVLPDVYELAREEISDAEMDALVYPDIGLDRLTYNLAFGRLAAVQCAMWGHPVTTGIPNVDYYMSNTHLETAAGDGHYTEQLMRLERLPAFYYQPDPPSLLKQRGELEMPEFANIYAVPQNLFKLHPRFDETMAQILRNDPKGQIVMLHGISRHWTELLQQRLKDSIPDVADRIVFVPRMNSEDFAQFLALSDVILDPFPFGGGTTTYESFGAGVPIVTMPGEQMRSRVTYACYQQMGYTDLVAQTPEQFVQIANKMGMDADARLAAKAQIQQKANLLFGDTAAVKEIGNFLEVAVKKAFV
ncbi:MAG: protein O-GlcNAc transferase [Pirellulaceae bacterium]|jgi:protein O-GlcNAc transferase